MMAGKLTADEISGKLLQGSFSRSGPTVDQLPDPIVDTPMVLTLDEMKAFEQNPRTVTNAKYKEIKESIRQRGLDHRPSVTRRPGEQKFTINNGGNTRLQILRELYSETGRRRPFLSTQCSVSALGLSTWGDSRSHRPPFGKRSSRFSDVHRKGGGHRKCSCHL
ncbi:Protein with ParB-like nuclease domain in PFGI-1-like cluster [Pseudomonas syringae pv. aptata]|uniref:Protein with ParB-like nuclease domain in PFGI-1-like cluster n=1 Tax=Pseudomonas syringae pv. aptata TaxID=83167 RepID=A0A3M5WYS8_PSEAP|nr:Protein with ParB-like nuclease domain in PFGI-1-like cluster [Pseudomonas syringae pv. aptata]